MVLEHRPTKGWRWALIFPVLDRGSFSNYAKVDKEMEEWRRVKGKLNLETKFNISSSFEMIETEILFKRKSDLFLYLLHSTHTNYET